MLEEGGRLAPGCAHCAETLAVQILDHERDLYLAELQRDDCPRHRIQHIRRVLAAIDERFNLLTRP